MLAHRLEDLRRLDQDVVEALWRFLPWRSNKSLAKSRKFRVVSFLLKLFLLALLVQIRLHSIRSNLCGRLLRPAPNLRSLSSHRALRFLSRQIPCLFDGQSRVQADLEVIRLVIRGFLSPPHRNARFEFVLLMLADHLLKRMLDHLAQVELLLSASVGSDCALVGLARDDGV